MQTPIVNETPRRSIAEPDYDFALDLAPGTTVTEAKRETPAAPAWTATAVPSRRSIA